MLLTVSTIVALFFIRSVYIFFIDYLVRNRRNPGQTIYAIPIKIEQLKRERYKPMVGSFLDTAFLLLAYYLGIIHFVGDSFYGYLSLFLLHVFVVEPIYYFFHRLLHVGRFYKKHHLLHHKSTVTAPNTSYAFTVTERLMYTILFSIPLVLTSALGLLSLQGLVLYIVIFDLLNIVGHTNVEFFPKKFNRSWFSYLIYTPSFHSQHHTKFTKNYSLFMPIYDYLFGTLSATTPDVFDRATNYEPLKLLSEVPAKAGVDPS